MIWAFGIIGHLLPNKWIHDSSKGSRNQDVAGPLLTPLEESPSGMMENRTHEDQEDTEQV